MSDTLTDVDGDILFDIESEKDFHIPLRQYIKGLENLKETNTKLAAENIDLRKQAELLKENAGLKMSHVLNSVLSACDSTTAASIMKSYFGNGKTGIETPLLRAAGTTSQSFDTTGSERYLYSINKSDTTVPPFQSKYMPAKDSISTLPTSRRLFDPVLDSYRSSDIKTISTSTVNNGGDKTEATLSRSQTKYILDDASDLLSPRIEETSIRSNYSTLKTDAADPLSYKRDATARSSYSYSKDDPLDSRRESNTLTNYSVTKDHPDDYKHDSGSTSTFSLTKDGLDDPSSYRHETSNRSNYSTLKDHPGGYKYDRDFTSNQTTANKDKKHEIASKSNYTTYSLNNGKTGSKLITQGPSSTSTYTSKFSSNLDKSSKYTPKLSGTSVKSGNITASTIGQPVATSTPIAARSAKDKGKSPKYSPRVDTTTTCQNKSKTVDGDASTSRSITTTTTTRMTQSDFVIRPSRRMIGEISYQLDRRILNYIFTSNTKNGANRRFYGYVVGNLPEKILRESVNNRTGQVDENKLFVLQHRLDQVLNSLRPLGYDIEHHSAFTADMVNKYGLLPPPPKERQVVIGKERKAEITEIIVKVADPGEVKDMLIVLECLAVFSNDDGKPFIIW